MATNDYPERQEVVLTMASIREATEAAIDAVTETAAAYTELRRKVRDLLDAVDYSADSAGGYDVRVRNLVSAALALSALDRLTGGWR